MLLKLKTYQVRTETPARTKGTSHRFNILMYSKNNQKIKQLHKTHSNIQYLGEPLRFSVECLIWCIIVHLKASLVTAFWIE